MKQVVILKIINPLLVISLLFQVLTVLLHGLFELHSINGFIFIVLAALHLFFNRNWIIKNYLKK